MKPKIQPPNQLAYARHSDPATSHAAASRVAAAALMDQVVEALEMYGPMNVKEIAAVLSKDKWSISPRMKPLEAKGRVIRVGVADRLLVWMKMP